MDTMEHVALQQSLLEERIELASERIRELQREGVLLPDTLEQSEREKAQPFVDFFTAQFSFAAMILDILRFLADGGLDKAELSELREKNHKLYEDILPDHYGSSYCNPDVAADKLGQYGPLLCAMAAEMRAMIAAAFEGLQEELVMRLELLLEVYSTFVFGWEEGNGVAEIDILQDIWYWYVSDYSEVTMERRTRTQVDPGCDFATRILMSDDDPVRRLYRYGEYITENEEEMARFLEGLSQEDITLIASTFSEGYRMGFVLAGIDLSKKKSVNVRYPIGFERIIREAVQNFAKMGLQPTIYRQAVSLLENKGINRIGYYGAKANPQFDYDHKEDLGLTLDKKWISRKLELLTSSYELCKEHAYVHAGPAVMESFGEKDFAPENKKTAVKLSDKQQQWMTQYAAGAGQIVNNYIRGDERSFTIMAFPVPEIGPDFAQIFRETIRINTLDYMMYRELQQRIIDTLDLAEYVIIKGRGANKTNMKVMLHTLTDPEHQTNFENCVADVNIPVGEVFTSPVLTGTEGTLHVTRVFLNELPYENLTLTFKDGMITSYTCTNFAEEEENKKLLKDAVLHHHETLPIGEFAIGTNTTAYVAAQKLGIADKLPILIAEKMGPHFAVGDTCYSHSEELKVYNPDGKEIIAKENEKSLLRKEHPEQAYFNCHTDITIPYDELGEVSIVKKDQSVVSIIEEGRFVLPGLEKLNEPFAELS